MRYLCVKLNLHRLGRISPLTYLMCNRPETAERSSPTRRSSSTAVAAAALCAPVASGLAGVRSSSAGNCPAGLKRTSLVAVVEVELVVAASAASLLAAAAAAVVVAA